MVKMKGFCYLALILVFVMFYSRDPIIAIVVLGILIALFIFTKIRKSNKEENSFGSFSFGKNPTRQNSSLNAYLILLLLQQNRNSSNIFAEKSNSSQDKDKKLEEIEKEKQKILHLLEGEDSYE